MLARPSRRTPRARGVARRRKVAAALHHGRAVRPKEKLPPSDLGEPSGISSASPSALGLGVELITQAGSRPACPSTTRCGSARPPTSTTTPFASPSAPSRRACRSSTTRTRSSAAPTRSIWPSCCAANGVPRRRPSSSRAVKELEQLEAQLSYPMVLKIPDGSFSRGVAKVGDAGRARAHACAACSRTSDLILAQEFMPTEYRLAGRRARRRAAVRRRSTRWPASTGRSSATRRAAAGRGRLQDHGGGGGAASSRRHRRAGGPADRATASTASTSRERARRLRDRGQRQPEPRPRGRGRGRARRGLAPAGPAGS